MRILALETSSSAASIAALDGDSLLLEIDLDPQRRSACTLAPGIKALLAQVGWTPAQVELVAVGIGPGSFTGLRLGVMTAKAFAFATESAILGVGTLDAIAARAETSGAICAAIDAQRDEVYCGVFTREPSGDVRAAGSIAIKAAERWVAELPTDSMATGPALVKLADQLPPSTLVAPRELWLPSAAVVGRLAALRAQPGARDDLWQLAPLYLRRSAAEEKWVGKGDGKGATRAQ